MLTVESLKSQANALYGAGNTEEAERVYLQALGITNATPQESAILYSNLAACHLKRNDYVGVIQACTSSLQIDGSNCKALFRRATAYYHTKERQLAVQDLNRLLSINPKNTEGIELMRRLKQEAQEEVQEQSHVGHLLSLISTNNRVKDSLQTLLSLASDNPSLGHEIIRKRGISILAECLSRGPEELQLVVLRLLLATATSTELVQRFYHLRATDADEASYTLYLQPVDKLNWLSICSLAQHTASAIATAALRLTLKILTHLPLSTQTYQDDLFAGEQYNDTKVYNEALLAYFSPAHLLLQKPQMTVLLSSVKTLLARTSDCDFETSQLALSVWATLLSTDDKKQDYVDLRNESIIARKRRNFDSKWLAVRAEAIAHWLIEDGALGTLLHTMRTSAMFPDLRLNAAKLLGALLTAYNQESLSKDLLRIYLPESSVNIDECLTRALLEAALCLTHPDMGVWAMEQPEGIRQLLVLVATGDVFHLEVVAELLYLLASLDKGKDLLAPLIDTNSGGAHRGVLSMLLHSPHASVRSNAASAFAKLAFRSKALKDASSETAHLLNISLDIIKAHVTHSPLNDFNDDTWLTSFSAHDNVAQGQAKTPAIAAPTASSVSKDSDYSAVERAVEVIASLIGQTMIKEEIVHGSYRVAPALTYLLSLPLTDEAFRSTLAYGLVHILCTVSVTNTELHQAQLAEKGITLEQYHEMQELQRIKATDDDGKKYEEEKESADADTLVMCASRVKKLVDAKAIPLLVKALEASQSSSATKLNAAKAMKHICVVENVRGKVIADGGLRCCTSIASNVTLEPEVRRLCSHAVAKMLVTTNSTVLSSHLRLDAIKPLLHMCNEDSYSYLEHFEALLALTNLTSCGEAEQNALAAQKGVKVTLFLLLSENNMVQRAAAELLCNVSAHKATVELFSKAENMRLLLQLCDAWAADLEENQTDQLETPLPLATESYKASRAAAGTLAGICIDNESFCKLLMAEKALVTVMNLFASVKYELVHRALVILEELLLYCSESIVEARGEEHLGVHAVQGVGTSQVLEATITAAMVTIQGAVQQESGMTAALKGIAMRVIDTLRKLPSPVS